MFIWFFYSFKEGVSSWTLKLSLVERKKNMNEREYALALKQKLSTNNQLAKYFKSYLIHVNERLQRWDNPTIRIGLVGVTSSGKSTLLNALLGDNMLPTAVRPSSGSIIICSKGAITKATVVFEGGKTEEYEEDRVREALKKYGDEASNPENQFQVREIHLQSKYFILPEGMEIIDSPGLDAYGLERHEELTLSTLLPTVDICLYVVTLKTNSDDTTKKILSHINQQKKPLIIVQNMLDSVEPKLGKNGRIEKTREDIAKEHYNRTKRILDTVDSTLHEIVQIVQVSAKKAVTARIENLSDKRKESQIDLLVDMLRAYPEQIGPQLFRTRGNVLYKYMNTIIEEEKKILQNAERFEFEIQKAMNRLIGNQQTSTDMNEKVHQKHRLFQNRLEEFNQLIQEHMEKIRLLYSSNVLEARTILVEAKNASRQLENQILEIITEGGEQLKRQAKQIGFELPELIRTGTQHQLSRMTTEYFELPTTEEDQEIQVKKSGIINKVKRGVGKVLKNDHWGYETEYYSSTILQKDIIFENLTNYQKIAEETLTGQFMQWKKQQENAIAEIKREQALEKNALEEKKKLKQEVSMVKPVVVEVEELANQLLIALEANEKQIHQYAAEMKHKGSIIYSGKRTQLEITELTYRFFEMSNVILQKSFEVCKNRVERLNRQWQPHDQTVVMGWDDLAIGRFMQRYFQTTLTDEERKELTDKGILEKGAHILVREKAFTEKEWANVTKLLCKKDLNAYILMNIAQEGQARKKLLESRILQLYVMQRAICNLVVQSFTEFIESGSYEEVIGILHILRNTEIFRKGEVLVNDANPLFSIMHLELGHSEMVDADAKELAMNIQNKMPYLIHSSRMMFAYHQYLNAMVKMKKGVK